MKTSDPKFKVPSRRVKFVVAAQSSAADLKNMSDNQKLIKEKFKVRLFANFLKKEYINFPTFVEFVI